MANRPKKKRAALGANPLTSDPLEVAGLGGTERNDSKAKRKPVILATSFRLDSATVGYLRGAAFATGRTAADIVESALAEYLPKIERETGTKFPRPNK